MKKLSSYLLRDQNAENSRFDKLNFKKNIFMFVCRQRQKSVPKKLISKNVSLNRFYIGLRWWSKIIIILCVRESAKTKYFPQGKMTQWGSVVGMV